MITDFGTYHRYRRLAKRGLVEPLSCRICLEELILSFGSEDEVTLSCLSCNTTTTPGLKGYSEIKKAVERIDGSNALDRDLPDWANRERL